MPKIDENQRMLLLMGLGVLVLLILLVYVNYNSPHIPALVTVGGYNYYVLLATTPQQWQHGLMDYRFSCSKPSMCVNGMLFLFNGKGSECFWMKDTPEPLTQTWIANGTVTNVYNAIPESTTNVCAYGGEVLELYQNLPRNISVGSPVTVTTS
jgi:uncharacterized membrane protein (UPF0127 family)